MEKQIITNVFSGIISNPLYIDAYKLSSVYFPEKFQKILFETIKSLNDNKKVINAKTVAFYLQHKEDNNDYEELQNHTSELKEYFNHEYDDGEFLMSLEELRKLTQVRIVERDIKRYFDKDNKFRFSNDDLLIGSSRDFLQDFLDNFTNVQDTYGSDNVDLVFTSPFDIDEEELDTPCVLGDIIRKGSFNSIIAKPKVGKTRLAHQLAYCFENGINFMDMPVTQGHCAVIDWEMSKYDMADMSKDLINGYGLEGRNDFTIKELNPKKYQLKNSKMYDCIRANGYDLTIQEAVAKVIQANKVKKIDYVFFDCFYQFFRLMGGDSNKDTDVTACQNIMKKLQKEGITVFYIHHIDKTNSKQGLDSFSGSSAHGRGVDECMIINFADENKNNGLFKLEVVGRHVGIGTAARKYILEQNNPYCDWLLYKSNKNEDGGIGETRSTKKNKGNLSDEELKDVADSIKKYMTENNNQSRTETLKEKFNTNAYDLRKLGYTINGHAVTC